MRLLPSYRATGISFAIACAAGLCVALAMNGCGTTMTPASLSPAATHQPALMQIRMGDAPADRVLSFEVTVGPITLTASDGTTTALLASPQRLELSHLSATSQLLSILQVPQGTYTSISIAVANPEIVFVDNTGTIQKLEPTFSQTLVVPLSPPLTITASPGVLTMDFNIAQSLTFDAQGNISGLNLSPASFTIGNAAVAPQGHQHDDDGELEDITGVITAVNGTSFTLMVNGTGVSLTFTTDSHTRFDDGASLVVNTIVTVEGATLPDGTLYASEIEGLEEQPNQEQQDAEAQGLITLVTGNPATALTFLTDQDSGSGMSGSQVGGSVTVDVTNAEYRVHQQNIDTSGMGSLPSAEFPFDATTIHAGQRVQVNGGGMRDDLMKNDDGGNGGNGGGGNGGQAARVELEPQTLQGTVSGLPAMTAAGPITFTLTVAPDSVFAMLSGQTQISVLWQADTDSHSLTAIANGDTIRARGLLFFKGSGFTMIAGKLAH